MKRCGERERHFSYNVISGGTNVY